MAVTSVQKDLENLSLTLVAEFDATVEQVWQLWTDPRKLERWWGPPGFPATVTEHELTTGGRVSYYMTGPEDQQFHGWWVFDRIEPPRLLSFRDGFADAEGNPVMEDLATNAVVEIAEQNGTARFTLTSRFASREALEKQLEMGVEEGLKEAVGQIDALLDEDSGPDDTGASSR